MNPPAVVEEAIESFRERATECDWNTPNGALNRCGYASRQFVEHCVERALTAHVIHGQASEFLGVFEGFSLEGPNGVFRGSAHAVAIIEVEGKVWLVDWTAPQYDVVDPWPTVRLWYGSRRIW